MNENGLTCGNAERCQARMVLPQSRYAPIWATCENKKKQAEMARYRTWGANGAKLLMGFLYGLLTISLVCSFDAYIR